MAVATTIQTPIRRASRMRLVRKRAPIYAGLTFYAILAGLPIYWMLITTFKPDRDLYNLANFPLFFNFGNGGAISDHVTMDHVTFLFVRTQFVAWARNTAVVCAVVVTITLAVAIPAGYALARLRFRGAESLTIGIFLTYLVPTTLLFLPLVKVISFLGLFDKLGSLMLAYPTFTIPFCTWLMAGFFKTIPFEIEEAAMIDGCSRLGAVVRVILPLRPNGNLGWVPADSLQLHATAVRILVDQSQRQLTMFRAGRVVLRTRVAIGAPATPTPNGRFSIAEVIRTDNPAGFIGPFVLPLTAFSNVLDTFDGGNGRVALHGTSVPSQLGQRVSHGCVRIRNTDLMRIVRAITPGVPVTVRA